MMRIKLTTDLCALRENSAKNTQNTVNQFVKGIHLSPGILVREYTYTAVKLRGSVTKLSISLWWQLSVDLTESKFWHRESKKLKTGWLKLNALSQVNVTEVARSGIWAPAYVYCTTNKRFEECEL